MIKFPWKTWPWTLNLRRLWIVGLISGSSSKTAPKCLPRWLTQSLLRLTWSLRMAAISTVRIVRTNPVKKSRLTLMIWLTSMVLRVRTNAPATTNLSLSIQPCKAPVQATPISLKKLDLNTTNHQPILWHNQLPSQLPRLAPPVPRTQIRTTSVITIAIRELAWLSHLKRVWLCRSSPMVLCSKPSARTKRMLRNRQLCRLIHRMRLRRFRVQWHVRELWSVIWKTEIKLFTSEMALLHKLITVGALGPQQTAMV